MSTVQEMKQFNREYGCNLCVHNGVQVPKGRGIVRIYPVDEDDNLHGEGLRNHVNTEMHAKIWLEKKVPNFAAVPLIKLKEK